MTAGDLWEWEYPEKLVTTQCSGWPCRYESVLDFVFTGGEAKEWAAVSEIIQWVDDFPDNDRTSDHRPVAARFWPFLPEDNQNDFRLSVDRSGYNAEVVGPTATTNANLRSGPGVAFPVVGTVSGGESLDLDGRLSAGDWFQLSNGAWIASWLVENRPGDLPVLDIDKIVEDAPVEIIIEDILYDGAVAQVESDEYVVVANVGQRSVNLAGWRINADDDGQDFWFPDIELESGGRVRVYTNEYHAEPGGFSFRSGQAIWRNKGECGHLYNVDGHEVDTYCY